MARLSWILWLKVTEISNWKMLHGWAMGRLSKVTTRKSAEKKAQKKANWKRSLVKWQVGHACWWDPWTGSFWVILSEWVVGRVHQCLIWLWGIASTDLTWIVYSLWHINRQKRSHILYTAISWVSLDYFDLAKASSLIWKQMDCIWSYCSRIWEPKSVITAPTDVPAF